MLPHYLLSRTKLQTPVWRYSGSPEGSSLRVAKDATGPAGECHFFYGCLSAGAIHIVQDITIKSPERNAL
jgi:hypothetical protein